MAFPTSLVSFLGFTASHTLLQDIHASQHNLEQAEILALETKMGTGVSTPTANKVLRSSGAGVSAWSQVDLTGDVTGVLPQGNGGTGTVGATGTGSVVYQTSPTIVTPTIASFTNATHNHSNAANGGLLGNAVVTPSMLMNASMTTRVATSETTSSTSYTDLTTTTDTVSVTIGANGIALVSLYCGTIQNDTAADYSLVAFQVSGANTIPAADGGDNMFSLKLRNAATSVLGDWGIGASQLLTGLTPGVTTFKMKYRVAVGGTGTFAERKISVVPL